MQAHADVFINGCGLAPMLRQTYSAGALARTNTGAALGMLDPAGALSS